MTTNGKKIYSIRPKNFRSLNRRRNLRNCLRKNLSLNPRNFRNAIQRRSPKNFRSLNRRRNHGIFQKKIRLMMSQTMNRPYFHRNHSFLHRLRRSFHPH
jgi:hypothetical protein